MAEVPQSSADFLDFISLMSALSADVKEISAWQPCQYVHVVSSEWVSTSYDVVS